MTATKCNHDHKEIVQHAATPADVDPTRTKSLRSDYSGKLFKRFRETKGDIRTAVVDLDVFGLSDGPPRMLADLPDRGAFQFKTNPEKIKAFQDWLDTAFKQNVLEPADSLSGQWQGDYVRRSYASGVKQATRFLKKAGVPVEEEPMQRVFNTPIHKRKLRMLYKRNFDALQKITRAVDGDISRILTGGLSQGWNPRRMASKLNEQVDDIGIVRARTMARTEVVHAHNEAALNRYEELGVKEVTAKVEWLTAGDSRVCPRCLSMRGTRYTVEEAHGILPLHPNCRCTWLPLPKTFRSKMDNQAAANTIYFGTLSTGKRGGNYAIS